MSDGERRDGLPPALPFLDAVFSLQPTLGFLFLDSYPTTHFPFISHHDIHAPNSPSPITATTMSSSTLQVRLAPLLYRLPLGVTLWQNEIV